MSADISITPSATGKRLLVVTPYNAEFVADVKDIGGRWEAAKRAWSVDQRDEERVRDLVRDYFGTDGSPEESATLVTVRIPLGGCQSHSAYFAGRTIAHRPARDAPVKLSRGVVLVSGDLPRSGGSMKYPVIGAEDAMVEVRDVPRGALEQYADGAYEIVSETTAPASHSSETEQLRARRNALAAQVAELDQLLLDRDPEGEGQRKEKAHEELVEAITADLKRQHRQDKRTAVRELVLAQQAQDDEHANRERLAREEEERHRRELRGLPLACRCGTHTCPPVGHTVAEYAKIKAVTAATVTAWCKAGKVPAARHRGRWYVTADQ
jgi:hypothetical protein